MPELISDYGTYDAFARDWHADTLRRDGLTLEEARERECIDEAETRLLWRLLGELTSKEVLFELPEWLAEEKCGVVDGTPTVFVGRIERETDKAIRVTETASVRPLVRLADRIHHLEGGLDRLDPGESDRRTELRQRLTARRRELERRKRETPGLREDWLPKSQLRRVVRRPD